VTVARVGRWVGLALAVIIVASAPWWGRRVLARMAFFRVRAVTVVGTRYIAPRDVIARLGVDSTTSVWVNLRPLQARVAAMPGVRSAAVERDLPATLVVRITESEPIALAPVPGGDGSLRAYDDAGRLLPLDPTRAGLNIPVVADLDRRVFQLLAGVRTGAPAVYAAISSVRRDGPSDLVFTMTDGGEPGEIVRARADVTPARLADVGPVRHDLARRAGTVRYTELDLRYRDQVIARLK
jgi:cell division septal protein FtsQ